MLCAAASPHAQAAGCKRHSALLIPHEARPARQQPPRRTLYTMRCRLTADLPSNSLLTTMISTCRPSPCGWEGKKQLIGACAKGCTSRQTKRASGGPAGSRSTSQQAMGREGRQAMRREERAACRMSFWTPGPKRHAAAGSRHSSTEGLHRVAACVPTCMSSTCTISAFSAAWILPRICINERHQRGVVISPARGG